METNFWLKRKALKVLTKLGLTNYLFFRKHNKIYSKDRINNILKTGFVSNPIRVKWELTMLCNLNCIMCHQKERRKNIFKELKTDQIKKIVDNLYAAGIKKILLKGGEIFVRKDIFRILDYIQYKGFKINIITNGTFINKDFAAKLNNYKNIEVITFSLDGLRVHHDKIRNVGGVFDKTIEAIKLTKEKNFFVNIACVLQKDNLKDIRGLVDLSISLGVDLVTFTMEMFYTNDEIEKSKSIMGNDIYTYVSKNREYPFSYDELTNLIKYFKDKSKKSGVYIHLWPPILRKYPESFYYNKLRDKKINLICDTFFEVNLNEKGEIFICPFIKKSFGNLLNQELRNIWNSGEIRKSRKKIFENNLIPTCERCCKLDFY